MNATQKKGSKKTTSSLMSSPPTGGGGGDDLVSEIQSQNVECFNAVTDWQFALTSPGRDAPTVSLDSEMDDPEIILTVAFNQIVSLKSISIQGKAGEERQSAPRTVKTFANKPNYQFDDCSNKKPTQKIIVGETECVFDEGKTIELDQVRLRRRRARGGGEENVPRTEKEESFSIYEYSIDRVCRRGDIFSAMIGARLSL